jgi:hypothetical protein
MNQAKIPTQIADPDRTIRSHMLSWISGQWNFRGMEPDVVYVTELEDMAGRVFAFS